LFLFHRFVKKITKFIFLINLFGIFIPINISLWNKHSIIKNIYMKLQNKVAVITGGNSGIGLATAQEFIAQGAQVVITGRNEKALQEAVATLGGKAQYVVSDASKLEENLEIAAKVKALGFTAIDILFYNAGVAQFAPVSDMTIEIYEANTNINYRGAFFTTQNLLPMINEGGAVIFNTTFLATGTMAGNSAYGASKAALVSLGKTLAVELASKKIRVNSLSPGAISTPIYTKLGMDEEQLGAFAAGFIPKIPMARFGEASEIAKAAAFLASSEASYVTGSELLVDGGTAVQW
jgi:NAD(P)-dependent dehydrogenase (short-subunit alcohol dehydrogenase family)